MAIATVCFARRICRAIASSVDASAPFQRVTSVRNEQDWKVIEPNNGELKLEKPVIDASPIAGGNRYYLLVEQADGSMGWSSPVWVKGGR